jgi:3-hydroxyisobutyrate dehydrogenase
MNVGFIGLGTMGNHMARHVHTGLKGGGHALLVYDVRRAAADPHLAQGASWAETPRAIAERCDVIFTSLPGPLEVEAVAFGSDGLLAGIRPGAAYFDLTTNSVSLVRRLHAEFLQRGAHMLDAPVSGGPAGAAGAKLALWVSGEEAVFNKHRPLLAAIGDQAKYIGPIGAGTVAKLVHNCAGYIINTALAEVFALGVKAGVDPLDLWQAARQGALGRRRTFDMLAGHFLPGKFDPASFALKLAHKDVGLAVALGRELGVPMRLANLTLEEMTEAMNRGWADRDSRVAMTLELERAGVTIKVDAERLRAATASEQA